MLEYLRPATYREGVYINLIPGVIGLLEADLTYNTKDFRGLLESTLDGFCNTECYDNTVFYYTNCSESQDGVDLYQNVVCGRDGSTYCALAGLEEIANGDINFVEIELQCNTDEDDCPRQECINILERISNSLGCCAGNLFNSSITEDSPFLFTLNEVYYEKCNLTLPAQCSGYAFVPAKPVVIALVLSVLLLFSF